MRTTVTLDEDVHELLRSEMEHRHQSFKQVLNDAVRRGLKGSPDEDDFVVEARPMELRPGIDPLALCDLDDEIEVEEFRRKTRTGVAAY